MEWPHLPDIMDPFSHVRPALLLMILGVSGILALPMIRRCVLWLPSSQPRTFRDPGVQVLGRARLDLPEGTLWLLEGPEDRWPSSLPGTLLLDLRDSAYRWTHPGAEERLVMLPGEVITHLIRQLEAGQRFLPPAVMHLCIRGDRPDRVSWVRVERIVQFVDVVGFTTLTRMLPPFRIQRYLEEVYHRLSEVVARHGGTVCKYMGDALLICYSMEDADPAFQAAQEMLSTCRELREERSGEPEFRWLYVGVGLASGAILEGPLGGPRYQEWAHIGDPVNTAARLQALTRRLPWWVISTKELTRHTRGPWPWVPLGSYRPDHPSHPVDVVALGVSLSRQQLSPDTIRHRLERDLRSSLHARESIH
jgi:class 3 adenylate cyclase